MLTYADACICCTLVIGFEASSELTGALLPLCVFPLSRMPTYYDVC